MKISEFLGEGYVQRNGAAMKLGSLRLHFYPDHVFYVDGRLDLSIYRDGAFKPPRSNEVYLKDAARLGIPKDFFTIVSYWLNTPVQKQGELLPRIESALNHIAEKHLGKKEDVNEGNKENKAKKNAVLKPSMREKKPKPSTFDPRVDLKKKVAEDEYDGEGSFLKNELQTIARVAHHLANDLQDDENVPTWVISKISQSKGMLVGAMDYMISKHERGEQPMAEEKQRLDPKCWKGYRKAGTKMKGGVRVNNCVKVKK